MKNLLLLAAAGVFLTILTPNVQAHKDDRDDWHPVEKTLNNLDYRYRGLQTLRDRYGSSPRIREEMERLRRGLTSLTEIASQHDGDPTLARKTGDNLTTLTEDLEAQYRDFARHGAVIHVHRDWR